MEPADAAAAFRRLRSSGSIQIFGVDRFKIHDAIRPLGRAFLDDVGAVALKAAREAIRDLVMVALPKEHDRQRVFLLLRMFVALGNVKPLVEMATDEVFDELGYMEEISAFLTEAAASPTIAAEDRFWALDGLVFAHFKDGDDTDIRTSSTAWMNLSENNLGLSRTPRRWNETHGLCCTRQGRRDREEEL